MRDKLHLLFITHFFPPTHNAGTENYTLALAKAFQARGHEVEVLCAEDWESGTDYWNGVTEDNYEKVLVHRVRLNWLKAKNPNKILYDSIVVENWLDKFLNNHKIDVVHVTSTYSLGVGLLRSIHRHHIPLVLTLMDFWFICPSLQLYRSDGSLCNGITTDWECQSCLMGGSHFFRRYKKFHIPESVNSYVWGIFSHFTIISKRRGFRGMLLDMSERKQTLPAVLSIPNVVLSHSTTVQKIVTQNTNVPVMLLRNGYDLAWLNTFSGKVKSDKVRFGYIGQIQLTKGVHILIEAFQNANLDGLARLDVWGDITINSQYVQRLVELVGETQSIKLHGRYEHNQLGEVLSQIDVLIVPSLWYENAPLVIQEAFATKTPVITTNLGGMAEAVTHEVNGLLFERGNSSDLGLKLQRIVNEPGLLEVLKNGISPVKAIDEEVDELEIIYAGLLDLIPADLR